MYDPNITQRVRKAVMEATDQHLAIELLLEHNERQDRETARIADVVKDLEWHHVRRVTDKWCQELVAGAFKERDSRIANLTKLVWVLIVPISMAAGALLIEMVRGSK